MKIVFKHRPHDALVSAFDAEKVSAPSQSYVPAVGVPGVGIPAVGVPAVGVPAVGVPAISMPGVKLAPAADGTR